MISALKPLLVGGGMLLAGAAFAFGKKRIEVVNPEPFAGQLFTVSKDFDNEVYSLARELRPRKEGEDLAAWAGRVQEMVNILMFGMWEESGIRPDAHVNRIDRPKPEKDLYVFGLYDDSLAKKAKETGLSIEQLEIGPLTHGGGLFGLIRKYHAKYTEGMEFERWLRSDRYVQLRGFRLFVLGAKGKIQSPQDMRMYGFASAFVGASPTTIVYPDGSESWRVHKYLDLNAKNGIEAWELYKIWNEKYNRHVAYSKAHGKPRQARLGTD